ncbi:MAG: DUF2130 domain-containing protein, partial [Bacteroidota bacterium]
MPQPTRITCPKCGHEFAVEDVISRQIEEKYRAELNLKITGIENEYAAKETKLSLKEAELKKLQSDIDTQVAAKLKIETEKKSREIRTEVTRQYEEQLKSLTETNNESQKQLTDLRKAKIENEQLKRKLDSQKQELEVEYEQKMTLQLKSETDTISKRERDRVELKLKEKEEVISSMKEQMEVMKRKAEQGSMQLQGEVQELALEQMLRYAFPFDLVSEVGKGVRGADCIQTVRNSFGQECGKIIFESKRTKDFSEDWVEKLKAEIANLSNNPNKLDSPYLLFPHEEQIDGKWIIRIQVPCSSQVHRSGGEVFLRSEDGDYRLKDPYQIAGLVNRKLSFYTEQRVIPWLGMGDLRPDLFDRARTLFRVQRKNH